MPERHPAPKWKLFGRGTGGGLCQLPKVPCLQVLDSYINSKGGIINTGYCTISTNCSQGVTCDAHEHYQTGFMSQILAVTGTKTVHL
jgi:hypothetical protein